MTAQHAPDHFSRVSDAYAAFRPHYPAALFDFLASLVPPSARVWDCGAGSGQATSDLANRVREVVATDLSAEQVARAPRSANVHWLVAAAEASPLRDATIDLTTVAQALHWFDHDRFYAEVRRVSRPGAMFAAWTYAPAAMDGEVGAALHRLMYGTVGPYWPAERRHVEAEYRTIPFPFQRMETPSLSLEEWWTPAHLAGYARTWSATARCVAKTGQDPVAAFEAELERVWGAGERRRIVWPLVLLAGRVDG